MRLTAENLQIWFLLFLTWVDTSWLRSFGSCKNNIVFCTPCLWSQSSNDLHLAHQVSLFYGQIMTTVIMDKSWKQSASVTSRSECDGTFLRSLATLSFYRSAAEISTPGYCILVTCLCSCGFGVEFWMAGTPQWTSTCGIVGRCSICIQSLWQLVYTPLVYIIFCSWLRCQKLLLSNAVGFSPYMLKRTNEYIEMKGTLMHFLC